jgi:transcriptional regulator with XRE-family HTH domain
MQKSIHTPAYEAFLRLLRQQREDAGLTQEHVAERLGMTQSAVSKCERGERRLDVIELRLWCAAMGVSFTSFTALMDKTLQRQRR